MARAAPSKATTGKSVWVFSTLTSSMDYTNYEKGGADLPVALPPVHIKGGAGLADKNFVTPDGVGTRVTEQQLEYLRANPVFNLHEKNGFIKVVASEPVPEKAASDMERRDGSAPIVPQDLPEKDQPSE